MREREREREKRDREREREKEREREFGIILATEKNRKKWNFSLTET